MSSTPEWATRVAEKEKELSKNKVETVVLSPEFVNILVHADLAGSAIQQGLSQDEQLKLYSRFKHGKGEVIPATQPGFMDFKGRAKWNAWDKYINPKDGPDPPRPHEAQQEYVELMTAILKSKGYNFETGQIEGSSS